MTFISRYTTALLTVIALVLPSLCTSALAQDTTHPQKMNLAEPQFERPDPQSLQLVLDNGLTLYVAEDHRAPLVTLKAFIGVGAAHGEPGQAAALAAALRRGPAFMSGSEFPDTLNDMNAQFSVTQHHEFTEILLDTPVDNSRQAMDLMGQLLSEPAFDGGKSAALQNKSSGSIDYNYSLVNALALFEEQLFTAHAFSPKASTAKQSAAALGARQLHKQWVVAANITMAVAGDFRRTSAVKDARRAFSRLSSEEAPAPREFPPLKPVKQSQLLLSDADRIQGWIVMGHELPIIPEEDEAALFVMDYILGAYHLDSRLYRSSRELRGLTNDNSSFLEPGIRGPGSYSFRSYGRPEVVRLLVDLTFQELEKIRETLATPTELFVAKGALIDGIYAQRYATGVSATQAYAKEWLMRRSHSRSQSYPKRVAAVTVEEVRNAARKYIHPNKMIVAVLGPLKKIQAAATLESEPQLSAWGKPPGH